MVINIQDDLLKIHKLGLLDKLLIDKTTKKNIMWATNAYCSLGARYERNEPITPDLITGPNASVIKTRARKAMEQQSERTRQHAEVFTPLWICRKMNDYADEVWFGSGGVFFCEGRPTPVVVFPPKKDWKKYVDSKRLEITCGEAPYLVSRYDVETGEMIPIPKRVGLLDRKLRVVNENAQDEAEWLEWAVRAFQVTYGFEFQGDNVLIARVNLLMTFEEYLQARWEREPTEAEREKLINIIAWNIWQMDGLSGAIPYGTAEEEFQQMDLFGMFTPAPDANEENRQPNCRIFNWRGDRSMEYLSLKRKGDRAMKFDFIIGNPPYQDDTIGDNKTFAPPIYHLFLDAAYKVADGVEMIHPARFLFNAGTTPKQWNRQMLEDPHLKVLYYEQDSSKVFSNTVIKGGIAITYHDIHKDYGAIGTFTAYPELNSIIKKVRQRPDFLPFSDTAVTSYAYHFTEKMHEDFPEAAGQLSTGHAYDLKTNVFDRLPQIFHDVAPQDGTTYIRVLGRTNNERVFKYVREDYINKVSNLAKYKIFLPAASGNGVLGETLTSPIVCEPYVGSTESFMSIGAFDTKDEANAALKYIKTKFVRILLGVLKVTQHITPEKWAYIPIQDYTIESDIDWSKSVHEIDQQLYAKYGLDDLEIKFVENQAKEME
ncbi:Eco57I restriction-modification methylase domain-containing protein [Acutalibacter caecimuris]|uniref:Eco57I restriction-modification methylase domain-containing protein n=1 Tax=Acutalibacter caecimuris TaxID=3093657 RepID=UPI002AC8C639|nr:Eco57I restriction-modification methylase domain-containing protein [Acutalibacter sp. M00118]